jgi:hypothetical protein
MENTGTNMIVKPSEARDRLVVGERVYTFNNIT